MKNLAIHKIKTLATVLACFIAGAAGAQPAQPQRVFNFKKGDEYYRQTATRSSCIIQMGKSQVHINSNSSVAKAYDVSDVSDNGFTFTVTTKKITSSLDVDDKHMRFDSSAPLDNNSLLAKGLDYMIDKPIAVAIDRDGIIANVQAPSVKLANDTLLAFTGIANEQYTIGNRFGIVSDFLLQGKMDKNFTWGDTTSYGDIKTVNKFWIQNQTADFTTIQFSSNSKGKMANCNTTGVYILSNTNGVIVQRVLQSTSVGYIYYRHNFYGSTRRWSVSESCYKIK